MLNQSSYMGKKLLIKYVLYILRFSLARTNYLTV